MSYDFKNSETVKNLMRSFAGESQARNRYTIAAGLAKAQKLHLLDAIFTFTANQEKEHAEIFYNHLKPMNTEIINIDGSYPVNNSDSLEELLRTAMHNEYEEHDVVYKSFAETARKEGYDQIAASFELIAKIEKVHGERFKRYAELMEQDKLFSSDIEESWFCLNCGHIHNGKSAPMMCPVCKHDQGFFIRIADTPYGIG
ncbi:MAG: rubrerythrin family protein [Ruminococcaceae bacterium]|nr:rubrerythrin family protein [Oscillospiraceae bacterium]